MLATSTSSLKPISLSVSFWHLLRYLRAQQHHLEPSNTKSLDVRGSNSGRPAPTGTLRTSQGKGTSFKWLLVTANYIVCWMKPSAEVQSRFVVDSAASLGLDQLNIVYLTPLFVKQLEQLTQHEDGAIRRAMEMLSYCYNH